jgi:dUTP pyrophosphatase
MFGGRCVEINQLKKSVAELAKTLGAVVESKLGDRSHLEEQMRGFGRQMERVMMETLRARGVSQQQVVLKFKKLEHFRGELPAYATEGASGLDVRARLDESLTLQPGERFLIPTGLAVEIPLGYEVQVRPRSGLAINKGLSMVNTPGTIDADYRGEVKVIVINHGRDPITIQDQDRIAQFVVCPVIRAEIQEVEDLSATDRGAGGFGSTGK